MGTVARSLPSKPVALWSHRRGQRGLHLPVKMAAGAQPRGPPAPARGGCCPPGRRRRALCPRAGSRTSSGGSVPPLLQTASVLTVTPGHVLTPPVRGGGGGGLLLLGGRAGDSRDKGCEAGFQVPHGGRRPNGDYWVQASHPGHFLQAWSTIPQSS